MTYTKVTQKYQTTIPSEIREFLDIHKGDQVGFEIIDNEVTLKKVTALDIEFHKALSSTLEEWASKEDDEAYNAL